MTSYAGQVLTDSEVAIDNGRMMARIAAASLDASIDRIQLDQLQPAADQGTERLLLAVTGIGQALLALNQTFAGLAPEPPRRRRFRLFRR